MISKAMSDESAVVLITRFLPIIKQTVTLAGKLDLGPTEDPLAGTGRLR
jgi:hypothetical protein